MYRSPIERLLARLGLRGLFTTDLDIFRAFYILLVMIIAKKLKVLVQRKILLNSTLICFFKNLMKKNRQENR